MFLKFSDVNSTTASSPAFSTRSSVLNFNVPGCISFASVPVSYVVLLYRLHLLLWYLRSLCSIRPCSNQWCRFSLEAPWITDITEVVWFWYESPWCIVWKFVIHCKDQFARNSTRSTAHRCYGLDIPLQLLCRRYSVVVHLRCAFGSILSQSYLLHWFGSSSLFGVMV